MKNLLLIFVAISLAGCATSPTGRKQLMLIDEGTIVPMAVQSFDEMKGKEKINTNAAVNRYVQCVVQPLTQEASLRYEFLPKSWEVVVFESKEVNAFAMPGGKIGVYTGLLALTENPDQLAAVLGHEIGHVVARHAAERMSTAQVTVLAMTAAGVALAKNNDQAAIMAALGIGAQVGVLLPFSRTHETEADVIGQDLMARVGFDPAQSVRLWELMQQSGGARPLELLSTHPDPQNRAAHLQQLLTQNTPVYRSMVASGKQPRCGAKPRL